jgi:hypothetical protein
MGEIIVIVMSHSVENEHTLPRSEGGRVFHRGNVTDLRERGEKTHADKS